MSEDAAIFKRPELADADNTPVGCANCTYSQMAVEDGALAHPAYRAQVPVKCGDLVCKSDGFRKVIRMHTTSPAIWVEHDFWCKYYYPNERLVEKMDAADAKLKEGWDPFNL